MLLLQLADFGADVVKVELPGGDPLRDWRDGGHESHWKVYARNKRSIVLNLLEILDENVGHCGQTDKRVAPSWPYRGDGRCGAADTLTMIRLGLVCNNASGPSPIFSSMPR